MEKLLQQILEGQARSELRIDKLAGSVAQLAEGQTQIINRLDKIDNRLNTIDSRLDRIESKLGENTNLIHVLSEDTARSVPRREIDTKINLINKKIFQIESDVELLKTAN